MTNISSKKRSSISKRSSRRSSRSSTVMDVGSIVSSRVNQFEETTSLAPPSDYMLPLEWDDIVLASPDPIGKGTFSSVYKARYGCQTMALKCLDSVCADNSGSRSKMKHFKTGAVDLALEAKMLERLEHPNVIKIHAHKAGNIAESVNSSDPYFIMVDYLDGTLEDRLDKWASPSSKGSSPHFFKRIKTNRLNNSPKQILHRVKECALGIATGMEYLHSKNVIFRDLKVSCVNLCRSITLKKHFLLTHPISH